MKTKSARKVTRRRRDVTEWIKAIIRKKGQTYVSLAVEIGITPQAVSEIVNGRTKGKTARYALAKALGLEVRDLWPAEAARRPRAAGARKAAAKAGKRAARGRKR
ncbi:MAG: helix-turn-helix transcriptional regulator [Gemmatimonadetes bacterium]|nr:helix-turn-helix transcriptional regulator [Gemmatimonadota bacterium]